MKPEPAVRFRPALPDDAERIALLHADSWRRHYRGAWSDSFLDGDVVADRLVVWAGRMAEQSRSVTILAEDGGGLAGFVHVILDADERCGSLVDNLHVAHDRRGSGIGGQLMSRAARATAERAASSGMYLWVLEQNTAAQRFYQTIGGTCAERDVVEPPGGDPSRLNGTPGKLRYVWPDCSLVGPKTKACT